MQLSIIIVNWKSAAYLRKCLASLYSAPQAVEFEVIVIDNASFDGSAELVAAEFPQVVFLQSHNNLGFSGANNLAFRSSTGEAVLFLNPDTEIKGDALGSLYKALVLRDDAGVVGAKLLNSDGTIQTSCIQRFPTILNQALDLEVLRNAWPKLRIWGMWPLFEQSLEPVSVDAISGACMMMHRRVFEQVGLFSTNYFMYTEDVDLCFKTRQAGLRNYYQGEAVVMHHGGVSSSAQGQSQFSVVTMRDSRWKFFILRRGMAYAVLYRISTAIVGLTRCAVLLACGGFARTSRFRGALLKWKAILQWGLGGSFQQRQPASANPPVGIS